MTDFKLFFQVLIDQRDWTHTASRAQTESVTFLNPENTRNLYALPGLDYVAHDDIIPYSTQDKSPIQHELFERFLASKEEMSDSDSMVFAPQSTLLAWQENWRGLKSPSLPPRDPMGPH